MIFFNLFTMIALAIWTPTPWWIIVIMFFFWAVLDLRTGTWDNFKIFGKKSLPKN